MILPSIEPVVRTCNVHFGERLLNKLLVGAPEISGRELFRTSNTSYGCVLASISLCVFISICLYLYLSSIFLGGIAVKFIFIKLIEHLDYGNVPLVQEYKKCTKQHFQTLNKGWSRPETLEKRETK